MTTKSPIPLNSRRQWKTTLYPRKLPSAFSVAAPNASLSLHNIIEIIFVIHHLLPTFFEGFSVGEREFILHILVNLCWNRPWMRWIEAFFIPKFVCLHASINFKNNRKCLFFNKFLPRWSPGHDLLPDSEGAAFPDFIEGHAHSWEVRVLDWSFDLFYIWQFEIGHILLFFN